MVARTVYSVNPSQLTRMLGAWRGQGTAYADLADAIRFLIRDGRLPLDTRIPAERALATQCGISRNTVAAAYGLLRTEGYLESRRGSGSFVVIPRTEAAAHQTSPLLSTALQPAGGDIDFTSVVMPAAKPILNEVLHDAGEEIVRYTATYGYDHVGLPELRQLIAEHYGRRGLPTRAEEIMVTNGVHHTWGLLLRLLTRRGDRVLVDSPTCPKVLDAVRVCGGRPLAVPMDQHGWDVDLIQSIMRQVTPALAYMMPDFHNPTGLVMSTDTRLAIADAAKGEDSYIVVDDAVADLRLPDIDLPTPMAAFGDRNRMIAIGSLSRVCWGGLQLGWLRTTPSVIARIAAMRGSIDAGTGIPQQVIATQLFGRYDELLKERRAALADQCQALVKALRRQLPGWRFQEPSGGLSLWIDLGAPLSTRVAMAAARHGVRILAGPRFGGDGVLERRIRIPFVHDKGTLIEGVRRLALAHREVASTRLN